jgi:hypothetical protein
LCRTGPLPRGLEPFEGCAPSQPARSAGGAKFGSVTPTALYHLAQRLRALALPWVGRLYIPERRSVAGGGVCGQVSIAAQPWTQEQIDARRRANILPADMQRTIPESDWKLFRQLQPIALDRYCQKVLDDLERISADIKKTPHQRYLDIYKLIERKDDDLARAFNGIRRSTAFMQLAIIQSYGVITEEEIARFSSETREVLSLFKNY